MRLNRQSKTFLRSFSTKSHRANVPLAKGLQYDSNNLSKELIDLIPADNVEFLNALDEAQQRFYPKYVEIRKSREQYQAKIRNDAKSDNVQYREDTAWIRNGDWKIGPIPEVLQDRPVELTGPADTPSMVINALNVGSIAKKVIPTADITKPLVKYLSDGEDASVPSLVKELQGILNLKQGLEGTLKFEKKLPNGTTKKYEVGPEISYPIYRVPGLHFDEATLVDRYNRPIPNHLLLTLLYQFHIAPLMQKRGWSPSLYQPKLQGYEEAVLVNDVLAFSEKAFGIPEKSTKVTCLIETLSGALQAEEIVYALKDYIVGLNAGRWDYIFQ